MPLSLRELSAILEEIPEGVKFPLEELPAETRWDVFLELPFPDLLKNCQVNRETAEICRSETFWHRYNKKHFDITYENYLYHDVRLVESSTTDTTEEVLTNWGDPAKRYTSKEMARVCYEAIHYYLSKGAFPMVDSLKVYLSKENVIKSFKYIHDDFSQELYLRNLTFDQMFGNAKLEGILKIHSKIISKPESLTLFFTELVPQIKFLSFKWSDFFDEDEIDALEAAESPLLLTEFPSGASFFKFIRRLVFQKTRYFVPGGMIELPFNAEMAFWTSYYDKNNDYCPFTDHIAIPLSISLSVYSRNLYNSFAPRLYRTAKVELRGGENTSPYLSYFTANIETNPAIDSLFENYQLTRRSI